MRLSENFVILKDSWLWSSLNNKILTYFELRNENTLLRPQNDDDGIIVELSILQDDRSTTIERKLTNIFDALAQTGGIMGIIYAIGGILVSRVQDRLFYLSILQKLYLT